MIRDALGVPNTTPNFACKVGVLFQDSIIVSSNVWEILPNLLTFSGQYMCDKITVSRDIGKLSKFTIVLNEYQLCVRTFHLYFPPMGEHL